MKTELEKLKSDLERCEAQLDKVRTSTINDGWQTQRFAKKSRNWDILAQHKISLMSAISELEDESCK